MKIRTVLSLFDGISCGKLALDRAGIKYDKYLASEIEKFALKVSKHNYPDIIQLGSVEDWKNWKIDWSTVDLLIGGSPCQGFSRAGTRLNFNDPRSRLFFQYVDILKHIQKHNPKVKFLLENSTMNEAHRTVISQYLGVEPVRLNSSLVSAQNRDRLYWANWKIEKPVDKQIMLSSIVGQYSGVLVYPRGKNPGGIRSYGGKSPTVTTSSWQNNFYVANYVGPHGRKLLKRRFTAEEAEQLQTLPVGYTSVCKRTRRYKLVGNGWTVDMISHIFDCLKKEYTI